MKILRSVLIVLGILLAAFSIVYGSILPLIKSRAYISASRAVGSVKNLQEFEDNFARAFNLHSPVGGEEIAKFTADQTTRLIANPDNIEVVARELTRFIEPQLDKENVRHLMILGKVYSILWRRFAAEEDFMKAEEYYSRAREIGPSLPQPLYGLIELYSLRGDQVKVDEIGEVIIRYWPNDPRIQRVGEPG